jgi:DNA-directed RNA polymerase subunit M/transcription elongation factor TFIIS
MADTITIACPECEKKMTAPAAVAGKKVRCKACGHAFAAKALPVKPAADKPEAKKKPAPAKPPANKPDPAKAAKPKPPVDDDEDDDGKPYIPTDMSFAPRCPDCANEMESETAIICLHCGYNTQTREKSKFRKVHDTTGGDVFTWLLPGIICAVVVVALITWDVLYCVLINEWVSEEDSWYLSMWRSLGIKLWMVIVSLFFIYLAGKFAVKRLILDNKPPEIERYS